jgi:hypothetical protein
MRILILRFTMIQIKIRILFFAFMRIRIRIRLFASMRIRIRTLTLMLPLETYGSNLSTSSTTGISVANL